MFIIAHILQYDLLSLFYFILSLPDQSRVGPVQWLKPYTDEVLVELGQRGVKSLLAVPVRYAIDSFLFHAINRCHSGTFQ